MVLSENSIRHSHPTFCRRAYISGWSDRVTAKPAAEWYLKEDYLACAVGDLRVGTMVSRFIIHVGPVLFLFVKEDDATSSGLEDGVWDIFERWKCYAERAI